MIDYLLGKPSPSWKRTQVFIVIIFWIWRLVYGSPGAPRFLWLRRVNRRLQRFSPWQIIVSTLTAVYAARNLDKILGFGAPEPLARLYSPSYFRATWIAIGLDAGFATAMSIRPKWLRDICSILFSVYYIIYSNDADEKIRRFRAVPTVEMLRTTWEKTTNPYLRLTAVTPPVSLYRKILLPRPPSSTYDRPLTLHVYFAPPAHQLQHATDLILDFPGGGFVAMTPEHHEERLRSWAFRTGKPVLSVEYGKAPEYPYPFAMDECFDVYRALSVSAGRCIGLSGKKLNIIMTGDSAGGTLVVGVMVKILQYNAALPASAAPLPPPVALVLSYAALDFNFTSWMSPENLRVLRSEQSSGNLPGIHELASQKDHLHHVSPLSMVGDRKHTPRRRKLHRRRSWRDALRDLTGVDADTRPPPKQHHSTLGVKRKSSVVAFTNRTGKGRAREAPQDEFSAGSESDEDPEPMREDDRPLEERVRYVCPDLVDGDGTALHATLEKRQEQLSAAVAAADGEALSAKGERGKKLEPIGTRLTMTSRTGYFQDRIIPPSMMRAMAILYIGPHHNPDFATDYLISPILTPSDLLAQFPPLLMQCGEKDPFVDDTVIFAGRVREAKRARKIELDVALTGKSARFGEMLQMSTAHVGDDESTERLKRERDQLAKETEDDWVQMVLFSDWSHGYLQMMALMSEARAVVEDLADWIDDAFVRYGGKESGEPRVEVKDVEQCGPKKARSRRNSPQTTCPSPKRVNGDGNDSSASPFTSETETETEDSGITFVARKRLSMTEGSSQSSTAEMTLHAAATPPQSGTPRGGNGKTGQRITESELMRRRRLLDAHIFEGVVS